MGRRLHLPADPRKHRSGDPCLTAPPFNPADPFDSVANLAKTELAYAGVRLTQRPEYKAIEESRGVDLIVAVMRGALTAVCGIVLSHAAESDENHATIRAAMIAYLPQAIDQARSIIGLPPLPEADQ